MKDTDKKAYLSEGDAKDLIIEIGHRMYTKDFVASNDGNISCKVSDTTIWCTPTGVSKGFMNRDMLVLMDLDGNVLEGTREPSSEMKMHLRVYKEKKDVNAVVHAHPPMATCWAVAGRALKQPILTEAILQLGEVPLAQYGTPGTEEVPDSVAPFVKGYNACLLANHGALTWGKNLMEAWMRMETVEYYAKVSMYVNGLIGHANELTPEQVTPLEERRKNSERNT